MKLTNIVFCLLLLVAATLSCVKEDLDDCLSTNTLLLSYKGDGTTEIFPEKICRVEMFVFDAENRCVNSGILTDEQVANQRVTLPPLLPGDYRIVCLGNTHATKVQGVESGDFSRMLFAATDYLEGRPVASNDSLYYASTMYTVKPYNGKASQNRTQTIEFASSHYDLLVEVAGAPAPGDGAKPVIEVSGLLPTTDFENRAGGEPTRYQLATDHRAEESLLVGRANIMRHQKHEPVFVRLYGTAGGALLAEINLAEFLADHPMVDCSKHEVLIPIRIEFASGDVTVKLPEWYVQQVKPEF